MSGMQPSIPPPVFLFMASLPISNPPKAERD